jgi:cystathionine beta-lyase
LAKRVAAANKQLGLGVSPDDAWLVVRGLKTMHARLAIHDATARALARWLEERPEVAGVLHPALESHPDHALWARDFTGAAGLFGVILKPVSEERLIAMLEGYRLFKMGFSWGGFESLVIPCDPQLTRTAGAPRFEGPLLRYQIGLEAIEDLTDDLIAGFARLSA